MPLLFTRDNKRGQNGDNRAVHRHGNRDLTQGNAVKQDFHILDAINRHAGFADIALDPFMVAVIATVRRQIERHRYALLTRI
jgi:hypothetical protein